MARFTLPLVTRLISLSFLLFAGRCLAQSPCQVKPGNHTVLIPLQNAPNSLEPLCQPARIRVSDRNAVTLRLTGLSPIEICVPNSKPQTITPIANPLETIINSVSALKSFDFGTSVSSHYSLIIKDFNDHSLYPGTPPPDPEKAVFDTFTELSNQVPGVAGPLFEKQKRWQDLYQADLNDIAKYLADDYRGEKFSKFDPEHDSSLTTVRGHRSYPVATDFASPIDATAITSPPSQADFSQLQAIVDEMSDIAPRLINSCVTAGSICNSSRLSTVRNLLETAKTMLAVAQDNLKSLQTAQAAVVSSYAGLDKVWLDYQNRLRLNTIKLMDKLLVQDIALGPDYGATDTGSVTCTSNTTPPVATTDTINYSVLYQNVPALTVSAGLLTTFQAKNVIGTSQKLNSDGTVSTYFAVTDHAAAQVFPMAFVNYRVWPPVLKTWPGQRENEVVITNSVSGGIGVNSNTGTNQPEFFLGDAVGFSRVYIHLGAHFGRTESLGGGFQLNTIVPPGFTGSAPISWSYHPAFSIGLSVRLAPF